MERDIQRGAVLAVAAAVVGVVAFFSCRGRDAAHPDVPAAVSLAAGMKSGTPQTGAVAVDVPPKGDAGSGSGARPEREVFFSPWGESGATPLQLGHERPSEGNPVGPMSLAHDARGRIYVLDQVNGRIVRHGSDGALEATTAVRLLGAQDLAVATDGSVAVLDRLGSKAIALYGPGGDLRAELPLEGEGVTETGLVTGLFVDGNDVYVEREHGPLVKIGDTSGNPANPRSEIPGRPSRDGRSFLSAGITDARAGRAYVASIDRATGEHRFTREIRAGNVIHSIQLLDSDAHGTLYFAVEVGDEQETPSIVLSCLEPLRGAPQGSAVLPANTLPEETFRDLTVLDDGGVILALRSEQGVRYMRYECR